MTSNFDDSDKQLLSENIPTNINNETEKNLNWEAPRKPIGAWRLWVPLLLQMALIVAVPAQAVYTYLNGKTAILQTAPVDPYDLLRGYYQTLSYDISSRNNLEKLPGWKELEKQRLDNTAVQDYDSLSLYVILEAPAKQTSKGRPQPWKPVRVSGDRPTNLAANQLALKGKYSGGLIDYGLETYYMPEDQKEQINNEISKAQRQQDTQVKQPFVVEVKVDERGHAVPISLWVRDRNYRF